ncbi:MAG TPA: hypothetical protein PKI61_03210 [bacterium]|nr:hypothetical protein [bacterium]HPT30056.1 hypothetical protein [bacterium]
MDKKTKTIVIVIVAVAVIGGLCYGFNRWRQQRLANQLLRGMYGMNTGGGLFGGDGKISDKLARQIAEEAAKSEAEQKADEAAEAAKTPTDRYNETKPVALAGAMSSVVKEKIEPILTKVFGKIKPILFSGNYMGQDGSFLVAFTVPKVIDSEDFNKLTEEFTSDGYTVGMSSIGSDAANLIVEKDGVTISLSYENSEEQQIGVLYYGSN